MELAFHKRLTFNYAGRDYRLTDVYGHVVNEIIASFVVTRFIGYLRAQPHQCGHYEQERVETEYDGTIGRKVTLPSKGDLGIGKLAFKLGR